MNGNLSGAQCDTLQTFMASVVWSSPPASGMSVAAFVDDGLLDERHLEPYLADKERNRADQLSSPSERRHFVLRRYFQRGFLKAVLGWNGALPELRIEHQLDTQPFCPEAPAYRLSFSSSGSSFLACAARDHDVGVDLERSRIIENVNQLAQRFFTPDEASSFSRLTSDEQSMHFLRLWTAKEAGLKAIGKGIVSGLNTFVVTSRNYNYHIEIVEKRDVSGLWALQFLEFLPQHIIAVVHRPHLLPSTSL
jgi:4'-phosphopantetheinyl transferase